MALQKTKERFRLKSQILLEAADRYSQSIQTGFKATDPAARSLKEKRQINFAKREAAKSELGLLENTETLFRIEEAQIDSWDAENLPPHKTASLCGKPVARIIDNTEEMLRGFGTGFLISDKLFVTNYHVFPDIDYAVDCVANFGFEYDQLRNLQAGNYFTLDPTSFFVNDKALDFAIVAIADRSTDHKLSIAEQGCIQLISTPGKIIEGSDINIIQYPLGNHKQYACKQNQVLKILEKEGFIQYITDTAKASSGSPCFNKSWELAALHHCSIPLVQNGKIIDIQGNPWNGRDEDEVKWIANEGISISAIISFLKANVNTFSTQNIQYLTRLLNNTTDPVLNNTFQESRQDANITTTLPPKSTTGQLPQNNNTMASTILNFFGSTVVYIGTTPDNNIQVQDKQTEKVEKKQVIGEEAIPPIKFDEDYEARDDKGYNPAFLGTYRLSVPKVDDARMAEMYREDGKVVEFKYYNYSLAMNKKRRMCMWTAVNVNYDKDMRSTKSRKEFGRDTWRPDPRLEDIYQVLQKELYNPAKNIDLGHIVRREDACWGDTEKFIEFANSDTFHMTNCTPQHEAFNRANPPANEGYEGIHGVWGQLEEHIKKELKNVDNLAVIFAGPSLAKNDPVEDFGHGPIKYPLRFWKVICVCDEHGQLFSYGFWLDQSKVVDDFGLGLERLDFNKFKKQQMPIREITERTKVIFDAEVYNSDILINNPFHESSDKGIPYNTLNDIQIYPK